MASITFALAIVVTTLVSTSLSGKCPALCIYCVYVLQGSSTISIATLPCLLCVHTSAEICSSQRNVDSGRGTFWACVDGDCVTAYVRYPNISPNPSITLCQRQNGDGKFAKA